MLEYTNYCKARKTNHGIHGEGSIPRAAVQRAQRHGGKDGAGSIRAEAGGEKKTGKNRRKMEALSYRRTDMQKEMVIRKLRERGCRITRQRLMLIDVILEEECSCCKEIFYRASEKNPGIGPATVYRLVNMLEEIGAISRKNMYRIDFGPEEAGEEACAVELDDGTVFPLSGTQWNQVVLSGLKSCGYLKKKGVKSVVVHGKR